MPQESPQKRSNLVLSWYLCISKDPQREKSSARGGFVRFELVGVR